MLLVKILTILMALYMTTCNGKERKECQVLQETLLHKKLKGHSFSNQKPASIHTAGSAFLEKILTVKRNLKKIIKTKDEINDKQHFFLQKS